MGLPDNLAARGAGETPAERKLYHGRLAWLHAERLAIAPYWWGWVVPPRLRWNGSGEQLCEWARTCGFAGGWRDAHRRT